MSDITVTWGLPTVNPRQRPISHTLIEFRVSEEAPWTTQDNVPADEAQELVFADVDPGVYYFRATIYDDSGESGLPAETSVDSPYDPPGTVTALTATIE